MSLLDSTNALPHSAQTWTRGPCVCRCFLMAELSRNILVQPLCGQAIVLDTSSNLSFLGLILQTLNEQTEYFRTDVLTEQNLPTVSGRRDQALVFLPQGSSSPSYTPCSPDPPRRRRPPRPPPVFHPSCPLQVDHNIKLMERGRCGAGAGSQFSDRSRPGPPSLTAPPTSRYHSAPYCQYHRHCTMVDFSTCLPPQATIKAPNSKQTTKTFRYNPTSTVTVAQTP